MENAQEILVSLSDAQFTRLLDIQEYDKQSQDAAVAHIFELGLSARENSIKATKQRKAAEKAQANQLALTAYLRLNPKAADDPVELLTVMKRLGIVPDQPISASEKAAAESKAAKAS